MKIETARRDLAEGCLLGLACGDALGVTLEGAPASNDFSRQLTGPLVEMAGRPPAINPGQVTDDTMMASCIARSLVTMGRYDPDETAARYLRWRGVTPDIGQLTQTSLSLVEKVGPRMSGREAWEKSRRKACPNGALMRCAPIGVFFATDAEQRGRATIQDASITHFDPRSILACAALNGAIASAVAGRTGSPAGMAQAAQQEVRSVTILLGCEYPDLVAEIDDAREAILADTKAGTTSDPFEGMDFGLNGGFVRTSLRLSLWELGHAHDFVGGLIDCVNRGGDADTNGAITGALLGSRFGLGSIPSRWVEQVLCAPQSGRETSCLSPKYEFHPKAFLDLLDLMFSRPSGKSPYA